MGVEPKQQQNPKQKQAAMEAKAEDEKHESGSSLSSAVVPPVGTATLVEEDEDEDVYAITLEKPAPLPVEPAKREEVQEHEPGAFAVLHDQNDRRTVPPSIATGSTTSSRNHPHSGQDAATPSSPTNQEAPVVLTALLVSDPPSDFENCQICMTACDSGQGWQACKDQCVPDATFSCHNDTLKSIKTVQEYADFIALFGQACPNATWTTHNVLWDGTTHTAVFHCTYHVKHTQSVAGVGPVQPTLRSSHANYCYIITTDPARGGKITHIQKLWNDTWMLRDLGWIPQVEVEQEPTKQQEEVSDNSAMEFGVCEASAGTDTITEGNSQEFVTETKKTRKKSSRGFLSCLGKAFGWMPRK